MANLKINLNIRRKESEREKRERNFITFKENAYKNKTCLKQKIQKKQHLWLSLQSNTYLNIFTKISINIQHTLIQNIFCF